MGRNWQRGFSTKRSPGEVASTGSEEDEEGVMKLQRGITKSSKKGGITGQGVWVFDPLDPSLENLQRAIPLIFFGGLEDEMSFLFGIRPIFGLFCC